MYTLLIVDDEKDIVKLLRDYFELEGYRVLSATNGEMAQQLAQENPDLILLDVNMPGIDGITLCKNIRNFVSCPILFLTAKVEEKDMITGFAAGGDDYITKPFSLDELGVRVMAHLRREQRQRTTSKVRFGTDLVIDYSQRALFYRGEMIPMAKKEFEIVELLSQNKGQVFDKERIYEKVWGWDSEGDSSVVAEHIRRIRAKFAAAGMEPYIDTVWGVGYKWVK